MYNFLTFKVLKNGNLRISLDSGNKRNLKELLNNDKLGSDQKFVMATEQYWTNGWGVYNADQLGQMTECLVISESDDIDDDGNPSVYGKTWTNNHNYQVINPLQEILEKGYVDFLFWQQIEYPEITEEEN